jgi:hypothetical protein
MLLNLPCIGLLLSQFLPGARSKSDIYAGQICSPLILQMRTALLFCIQRVDARKVSIILCSA